MVITHLLTESPSVSFYVDSMSTALFLHSSAKCVDNEAITEALHLCSGEIQRPCEAVTARLIS